ncbi:MAG: nitroreductase family deazaflavin-dependent oxidoreductase [Rubrobacter sp.]|nr:nitroreductase family deazaflavin-dependent oxidoreductase [Rubrobacter sp.]
MSKFMHLMNRFPALLLRSPLHGLMSKKFLLITFAGRKSGKRYTIPVSYLREGDAYLMTTDSPWWKNLRGGAPVRLRVKNKEIPALGDTITDEREVTQVLERFLEEQPGYGKYIGLDSGPASRAKIEQIAHERVVVRARTEGGR